MHSDHIHLVWPLPTFILHLSSFYLFIVFRGDDQGAPNHRCPSPERSFARSAGNGGTTQPAGQGSEPELEPEPRRREELLINGAKKGRRKSLHFPTTGIPFLPQTNSLLLCSKKKGWEGWGHTMNQRCSYRIKEEGTNHVGQSRECILPRL